jgi:hypothetical protein
MPIRQGGMLASRASSCPRQLLAQYDGTPLVETDEMEDVADVDAENGDGIFGLAGHGGLLASGAPRRGVLRGAPQVPISGLNLAALIAVQQSFHRCRRELRSWSRELEEVVDETAIDGVPAGRPTGVSKGVGFQRAN